MRLIDAEKLAEVLNRYLEAPHVQLRNSDVSVGLRMGIKTCLTFLNNANTIEAEPVRHGRWIDKGEYAVCTECGGRSGTQYDGVEPVPLMVQFCPNCGAKMCGDRKEGADNEP